MKRKLKKSVKVFIIMFIVLTIVLVALLLFKFDKIPKQDNLDVYTVSKEEVKEKKISLFAVGDVLIHESVYKDAYEDGTYDFSKMFEYIEPIMKKYDLKYCNQESTIGGSALGISGYPSFNSPDEIGDELVKLGFNLISLANNHALDKGIDAVHYSNSYWKSKNVITAGAYESKEERDEVKVYEMNGIKYAYFAYTTLSNSKVPNDYLINMYSADRAQEDIEKVKDKVDVIIVSMHWGVEFDNEPTDSQKQIAEYLSGLGVNVIIGSHPHVVQPVEYIGDTLVIYSLGNFISNQLSISTNAGIGLMLGMDIIVNDEGVKIDNLYKELILSYADQKSNYNNNSNFKVIPFSKLTDNYLEKYKEIENKYMKIVNGEV